MSVLLAIIIIISTLLSNVNLNLHLLSRLLSRASLGGSGALLDWCTLGVRIIIIRLILLRCSLSTIAGGSTRSRCRFCLTASGALGWGGGCAAGSAAFFKVYYFAIDEGIFLGGLDEFLEFLLTVRRLAGVFFKIPNLWS